MLENSDDRLIKSRLKRMGAIINVQTKIKIPLKLSAILR